MPCWAYLYDLDNVDDFVEKFLDEADGLANRNDKDKLSMGHCVHQIGIIIKGKDADPKFNRQKLIRMWKRPSVLQHDLDRWFRGQSVRQEGNHFIILVLPQKISEKV